MHLEGMGWDGVDHFVSRDVLSAILVSVFTKC